MSFSCTVAYAEFGALKGELSIWCTSQDSIKEHQNADGVRFTAGGIQSLRSRSPSHLRSVEAVISWITIISSPN
jgi:phage host-nuclease inhibitor protein Gam